MTSHLQLSPNSKGTDTTATKRQINRCNYHTCSSTIYRTKQTKLKPSTRQERKTTTKLLEPATTNSYTTTYLEPATTRSYTTQASKMEGGNWADYEGWTRTTRQHLPQIHKQEQTDDPRPRNSHRSGTTRPRGTRETRGTNLGSRGTKRKGRRNQNPTVVQLGITMNRLLSAAARALSLGLIETE